MTGKLRSNPGNPSAIYPPGRLDTTAETARYLRITTRTLERWRSDGRAPGVTRRHPGGRPLYFGKHIIEAIERSGELMRLKRTKGFVYLDALMQERGIEHYDNLFLTGGGAPGRRHAAVGSLIIPSTCRSMSGDSCCALAKAKCAAGLTARTALARSTSAPGHVKSAFAEWTFVAR